jgi:uncharacterized membrane protein YphA (DoxX/SURF4 family)
MWNIIIKVCRLLVGSLFIVSGLIKANDALGFMYKLEEYFEPGALNLPGLTEWALPLAVFICVGEILLGVAMVIGALPRLTAALTGVIMAIFTWLTWYTASCDPFGTKMITDAMGALVEIDNQCVLACGCFGNAIPLTPYESFIKDVVLSVLTVPILIGAFTDRIALNDKRTGMVMISASLVLIYLFGELMLEWNFPVLFAAGSYIVAEGLKMRLSGPQKEWAMALGVTAVCVAFQVHTLNHLPLKDYRAYAVGENIIENRKSAEELGLDGPVYATEYTFRNVHSGVDTVVLSTDWLKIYNEPWFKNTYETVSFDGKEVKVADGYEPRILDFQIIDKLGDDRADEFLNYDGNVLLFVSKDLENANTSKQAEMNALANAAGEAGWMNIGLTNAPWEENRAFQQDHGVTYGMFTCDQTELKIVVRSNPGIVWLKDGVVQEKWAWRDVPSWEDLSGSR